MKNKQSQSSPKASRSRGDRSTKTTQSKKLDAATDVALTALIKLGVDTHKHSYTVCRMIDNGLPQPPQNMAPEAFVAFVKKQKKLAHRIVVAYEAGPFGFHLHRQLTAQGVECLVTAPRNWDEGNKKFKTDKIDSRQIAMNLDRHLAGNTHALATVRVPTLAEEIARDLSRERDQFKQDRVRMINRGRALMRRYGVMNAGKWWEQNALSPLRTMLVEQFADHPDRESLADCLIGQMADYAEQILSLDARLNDLTLRLEEASKERQETRLKGFGHLSLEKINREVCDWKRFKNRRQVASYTGLCSGRDESGGRSVELSVNKCGNPRLRHALVELAWLLPRYQPDYKRLQRWKGIFDPTNKVGKAMRKKAIVALARQLAVDLWRLFTGRAKAQNLGLKMAA